MNRPHLLMSALMSPLLVGGLVMGGQGVAHGAPAPQISLRFEAGPQSVQSPYTPFGVYLDDTYAGRIVWSRDPGSDLNNDGQTDPGDSAIAHDQVADGWGIEARLPNGAVSTTRGMDSPVYGKWASHLGAEGTSTKMTGCVVRGSERYCDAAVTVYR